MIHTNMWLNYVSVHVLQYYVLCRYYSAPVEERSIAISLSVCLSVRRKYLWNRWTDLHEILCADSLWLWLGPPLAALRYVMYFRFMDDVIFGRNGSYGDYRRCDTWAEPESDVYECLVFVKLCFCMLL